MSETRDDGGPAFPPVSSFSDMHGMTLRDWFAGQALVGIMLNDKAYEWNNEGIAYRAYAVADAMIKERQS